MNKVFLGGTCNGSSWRDDLIKLLNIDYFNPIVKTWDEAAKQNEIRQRKLCDFVLYVLTPKMTGVYSAAEVTDDSNKRPSKTLLVILNTDGTSKFSESEQSSIDMVRNLVVSNGAKYFSSLAEVASFLNKS